MIVGSISRTHQVLVEIRQNLQILGAEICQNLYFSSLVQDLGKSVGHIAMKFVKSDCWVHF